MLGDRIKHGTINIVFICFYTCCTLTNRKKWHNTPNRSVKNIIKHSICSIFYDGSESPCSEFDDILRYFARFDLHQIGWKEMIFDRNLGSSQCCWTPHRSMSFLFMCSRCQVRCSTPKITIAIMVTIHKDNDPACHFHFRDFYFWTMFSLFHTLMYSEGLFR